VSDHIGDKLARPRRGGSVAMLTSNETALRNFLARFLEWADEHKDDVERAVCSAELAATHRAALVLLAETDFVSIALALHRVTRGASAPFVL